MAAHERGQGLYDAQPLDPNSRFEALPVLWLQMIIAAWSRCSRTWAPISPEALICVGTCIPSLAANSIMCLVTGTRNTFVSQVFTKIVRIRASAHVCAATSVVNPSVSIESAMSNDEAAGVGAPSGLGTACIVCR